MANLAAWVLSLVSPLVLRVMALLGLGVVSYAAIVPLLNTVLSAAASNYGAIPQSISQFLSLVGAPQAFGLIGGAMIARLSLVALSKIGRVAGP